MSLLDFQHPDIFFGINSEIYCEFEDKLDTIILLRTNNNYYAIKVHAHRKNYSQIWCRTYYAWDCTNKYKEKICNYHPGHEEMPPIPGQKCYNCGNLRAELIEEVFKIRKMD